MAVNIQPLGDRIVVVPDEGDDMTPGGILLPEMAKERPQQGTISAVGPGRYDERGNLVPMSLKAGDRILFARYSGTEVKLNGSKTLIFRETDVLAKVNED